MIARKEPKIRLHRVSIEKKNAEWDVIWTHKCFEIIFANGIFAINSIEPFSRTKPFQ